MLSHLFRPCQYNKCAKWVLVPIFSRFATHARVIVVSSRNRRAIAIFSGSPLRRSLSVRSVHFRHLNSSLTIRSALASADSRNSSP